MATVDLVIRGGPVFDGSGGVPTMADVAGALPGKLVSGRQAAPGLMAAE